VIARIVALFTLAAAIAVFATAPLEAQRTGTRLGGNAKKSDPEAVLRVVAQCAADRKPAYALALLDALPGSDEESRQFRRGLGDLSNCMDYDRNLAVGSDIMTASALAFRLMLVEQMVANRLKSPVDTAAIGGGEPWFLALIPEGESEVQADARYMVLMEFGDCVVSAAPSQSVAFISAISSRIACGSMMSPTDGSPSDRRKIVSMSESSSANTRLPNRFVPPSATSDCA